MPAGLLSAVCGQVSGIHALELCRYLSTHLLVLAQEGPLDAKAAFLTWFTCCTFGPHLGLKYTLKCLFLGKTIRSYSRASSFSKSNQPWPCLLQRAELCLQLQVKFDNSHSVNPMTICHENLISYQHRGLGWLTAQKLINFCICWMFFCRCIF